MAAALILVSILIGIGGIYNSISIPKEDTRINQLAKEIKYECAQTLNYAAFQGLNSIDTNVIIKSLVGNYSKLNPDVGIFFWLKLKDGSEPFSTYYKKGEEDSSSPFEVKEELGTDNKRVVIQGPQRNIYYNLSAMDKINNLYVLVEKEDANGRTFDVQ